MKLKIVRDNKDNIKIFKRYLGMINKNINEFTLADAKKELEEFCKKRGIKPFEEIPHDVVLTASETIYLIGLTTVVRDWK